MRADECGLPRAAPRACSQSKTPSSKDEFESSVSHVASASVTLRGGYSAPVSCRNGDDPTSERARKRVGEGCRAQGVQARHLVDDDPPEAVVTDNVEVVAVAHQLDVFGGARVRGSR